MLQQRSKTPRATAKTLHSQIDKEIFFNVFFFTLQYCIGFAIHQHESATGVHMFPILKPPPSLQLYHDWSIQLSHHLIKKINLY